MDGVRLGKENSLSQGAQHHNESQESGEIGRWMVDFSPPRQNEPNDFGYATVDLPRRRSESLFTMESRPHGQRPQDTPMIFEIPNKKADDIADQRLDRGRLPALLPGVLLNTLD